MTSHHFDDGWDNWGEDWNENSGSSGNNNNKLQSSQPMAQQNQQYAHPPLQSQHQPAMSSNAPIYSPFAYQQQPPMPLANVSAPPSQSPFMNTVQQQAPTQSYAANPVNFFNPAHYGSESSNNNNSSAFNSVQAPHFEKVTNYASAKMNTMQFSNSNLPPPPPAQTFTSVEQSTAATSAVSSASFPLPPPSATLTTTSSSSAAQNQNFFDSSIQGSAHAHQPPSSTSGFDSNFNPMAPQPPQNYLQQFSQWNDQRSAAVPPQQQQQQQVNSEFGGLNNSWQHQAQQPQVHNQSSFFQPPPPLPPVSTNDWQNVVPPVQQQQQSGNTATYNAPVSSTQTLGIHQQQLPQLPPKFENNENIQTPVSEPLAQPIVPPPPSQPSSSSSFVTTGNASQPNIREEFDSVYPENRERLDELPSVPTLDRHNYMVTGQLSQDHSPVPSSTLLQQSQQEQQQQQQHFGDSLPPPGLSRLVVGEPENNQQHVPTSRNDVRMVTGNEMTPTSYLNYQRQADGEVSTSPIVPPIRSHVQQSNFSLQQQQQPQLPPPVSQPSVEIEQQQNFNISDRNLYLVAGESDANIQRRVVPGVESDSSINAPSSVINPLQNLHIEDDEDFVNISVTTQPRNIDGDGMDEEQRLNQRAIDAEQREEDIEGANDSNVYAVVNPPPPALAQPPAPPLAVHAHENVHLPMNDQESSDIREDIEGANDYSDPPRAPPPQQPPPPHTSESQEEKRRSVDSGSKKLKPEMSSEDSELRELDKSARSRMRRGKKYDDSNDSESDHGGRRKDKYDDRYKRSSRDKMTREEYEKYRRRDKEKRSGGGGGSGRPKRNDDTDGSRYESRRRTDDEEEDSRRRQRRSNRGRRDEDMEGGAGAVVDEEKERKREKNRDRKKYYDDKTRRYRERDAYYAGGRPGSQNASDREFDRYTRTRAGGSAYEGYYQPYGYDASNYNYSYYQQQQYFETLRRTNPQAYEWYKTYYSGMMQPAQMQPPSTVDATESLKSGYSSSNERDRASTSRFLPGGNVSNPLASLNTSFIDNSNDYHSLQSYHGVGKDFNQPYASLGLNSQSYGYDMYGDLRAKADVSQSRMTPQKFQCLHGMVSLTNGVMTTVDTLNTDESYLVKIENVPIYDRNRRLFQSYPGPLVRGVSHKKTVIEFCEEKLKQNTHLESGQRASYSLLWSYLILMLRQNGTYTEADISELLMKNSDEFKSLYEVSNNDTKSASNNHEEEDGDDENNTDVSDSEENVSSERNTASQSQDVSTSAIAGKNVLDKFKNYLLYGNINDALDYATDSNLWGHALFLASKVDRRQHANVMLKFANKLAYNDPLQTLYQIMSGRMPACVTNLDDKFGDWRPHLAMIISNCTDKPELVKRSIVTLGDTLLARGDVFGSHFCYLLMDPQFTDYSDTSMANGKIALLGTTIQKPFNEFASAESIIMTEVYEYARSLSSENYFITSLQKYKFLLATNILDYGNQLKCLLYVEQISKCMLQQPHAFDGGFLAKVYTLADRLKFYDPVMEKSYEDNFNNNEAIEDPKWLQDLSMALQSSAVNVPSQQQPQQQMLQQQTSVPAYSPNEIYNNTVDYQQQQQPIYDPMASQHQTPTHVSAPIAANQTYEEHDSNQYNYDPNVSNQMPPANYGQDASFSNNQYQQPDPQQQQQQQPQSNYSFNHNGSMQNESMTQGGEQQSYMQPTYEQNYQQPDYNSYNAWEQPRPTITMGNASNFEEQSANNRPDASDQREQKKSPAKKGDDKDAKKQAAQETKNASGGGWFSGLFFGKAKSTQMKLPDDKNPSIVWDEATKKWVNKDADPEETESFKPPPTMGDMMRKNSHTMQSAPQIQQPIANQVPMTSQLQQMQQQQQQQPQQMMMNQVPMQNTMPQQNHQPIQQQPQQNFTATAATDQGGPPMPAAPNMFKMQKGRNLKKSYVDVLGNAGHTVSQPKELAPQMDMQFFNPQAQPQGMQFYNPNDFQ